MSRSERRAYKRMTKNQDPYALPVSAAQRARLQQRQRARRPSRATDGFQFVTGRFLVWALGGAFVVGLGAFSIAWPNMPLALYVGLAAAAAWSGLAWLVRSAQARGIGSKR